jgi:peptide/nickel transport system substrate-binding protein
MDRLAGSVRRANQRSLWKALAVLAVSIQALAACRSTPSSVRSSGSAQDTTASSRTAITGQGAERTEAALTTTPEPITLRIGTLYIWDSPNPAVGWYNYALRYMLYDTLVEQAGTDRLTPGLAESWSVSDDGFVWSFQIREGVTFHDGTPCTADEIAWSLNWIIENKPETLGPYLANVDQVIALDPTTLQVMLSQPVSDLEYLLAYVWILPRSVWEGVTGDAIQGFQELSAAIGTGPYKLVDWLEGEYLVLEANDDYWRGAPAIERIVWQEFPTADDVIQALLDGEIDVIAADTVSPAVAQTLQGAEHVSLAVMKSTAMDELIINSYAKGSQPASLKDPDVRLAIAYGIDKQRIVDAAYDSYAEPGSVVIPPAMGDWHNSSVQDIPFDPEKGAQILEEAGYKDVNADGIREDRKGNPLRFRLYGANETAPIRIMSIISDGLAQMGISISLTPMDDASQLGVYPEFDFDLMYWGWGLGPDPSFPLRIFTCSQRAKEGWNDSGYCNQDFDALYEQQAGTMDQEARRQLVWEMQKKLFDERPYIVLTYGEQLQAYRSDRFAGFEQDAGDILWKSSLLRVTPVQ